MADPIFDEAYIMHLLTAPPSPENCEYHQTGAAQALVDLYDRKVTREEFITAASQCLSLYSTTSKLRMVHAIRDTFDSDGLSAEKFDKADHDCREVITKQAGILITTVKRLMQCPTSEDKVH